MEKKYWGPEEIVKKEKGIHHPLPLPLLRRTDAVGKRRRAVPL
jgi:hypothetical protein